MNEEAQKRILSYFIEEARDHLATIEQGLLSLRDSVSDPELINELFRAAHSIKGGAAMLGLTSIQQTAHRLEDFFNVFRSRLGEVPVDQHLETLLLRVFDGLTALLDELQSPRGLTQEFSNSTLAELEPVFQETENYIQSLLGAGPVSRPAPAAPPPPAARTLQQEMAEVVPQQLRQMLELFKRGDQPGVREQLLAANAVLKQIGQVHHLVGWQQLTETFEQALGNPDADLRTLALVALRDLKQGQQLVLAGRAEEVAASAELQQLAHPVAPAAPPDPLEVVVHQRIPALLRQMLELFKRPDDPATRPALQSLVQSLQEVGEAESVDLGGWTALARLIGEILADPAQDLRQLALPVLRDLKQAHQALASGAAHTIQPSSELLAFRPVPPALEEPGIPTSFDLGPVGEPEPLFREPASTAAPADWAAAGIPAEESSAAEGSQEPGSEEATPVEATLQAEGSESVEAAWDLLVGQPPSPWEMDGVLAGEESPGLSWSEMSTETLTEEDWQAAADLAQEGVAAPEEAAAVLDGSQDRLGFGSSDFEATPLSLEAEASSAFDELFANAEQLSDIEEPPPELIPPSPEPFSQVFEELSPEEGRGETDLAELFAAVVDEAAAELASVEPTELRGAEETSQAVWDVPLAAQVAAASLEEAPAADEAASAGVEALFELEELAVESSPLQELSQLPDLGAAPDSGPEADLWVEELSSSLQPIPGDGEAAADLRAEFSADLWPEDFSVPDETGSLTFLDSAAEGSLGGLVSAADQAWSSLEEASEPSTSFEAAPELSFGIADFGVAAVEQLENLFAEESSPALEGFAAAPESVLAPSDEPTAAETPDLGAKLGLADLFAGETLEDAPGTGDAAEAQDWALLENLFPVQEGALYPEGQPAESFDRLEALFAEEPDTEGLGAAIGGSLSALDTDGDGQVDLDELSQFLAEAASTQEDLLPDAAVSLSNTEAFQASSLAEVSLPEPLVAAPEQDRDPQPAEDDLASQLESLFTEDEFLAAQSATVSPDEMRPLEEEAPEASPAPSLDDLAALFDAAEPAVPPELEEVIAPIVGSPAAVSSEVADDFAAQLESLLGDLEVAPQASAAAPAPSPPAVATAPATPAPATAAPTAPATPTPPTPRRSALSNPVMRVEVRHLDSINNLVGELVVIRNSMEQNQTRLRQFLDGLLGRVQQLGELGQRMRDQYDRSLLEAALFSSRSSAATVGFGRNGEESTRGRVGHSIGQEFDKLEMDQFTTFHTLAQEIIELIVRVRESSSDIEFAVDEAEQITRQFRQVTTQLQEGLNRARMVPFAQIADRLPRAVRDLSIKTGKQASLVVEGRDTLIDKAILEELSDPMTHLVNNALVHGIEPPEERRRLGKPPEGKITVRAFYQGNQTIIVVADDGAGIPVEKIKAKAQRLGLLSEQATEDEVFNVLFHPGFSSREASEVDDLAGRGVGLDVVRRNITDLRGSIQVDSVRGKGTTFTIRLPLTLSISKAMVCVSDKALIAFPLDGVEEMLDVPVDEVQPDEQGRPSIPWRDQRLPFQPLSNLLSYSRSHSRSRSEVYSVAQDEGIIPIVVLQSAGQYLALQVDSFVEEQEIVIKQLRGPVPKPPGISGATVLGNGRVLPIADVLELVDMAQGRRRDLSRLWAERRAAEPRAEETHQTTVLIVDDSIAVRELLSMSFQKVGYRVEQARDGQDAWEKLRGGLRCDLIFCDIEMPRMDGLELLSRIRADSNLKHIPVAMLTSRGAERHRQTARELGATAYFTKPYLEEELFSAAARMLQGEQLLAPNPTS
ncbi:response regulator [Synechococcus sp. H60.4]|uniref:response regulator n=2 Tax=unclassified Synechococcus TaxID=2626047 RepID=UPI0039C431FF